MDERLTKLETRLDAVLPTLATKSDVGETRVAIAESKSDIIKWLAGTVFAAVAIIVSVLAFMLNRAIPQQPAASAASQPIIINVPTQPSAPPAAVASPRP